MSQPPDNNDELLPDDPSLEEARTWWRKNVDPDAQARALVKALQAQTARSPKKNVLDSLVLHWESVKSSRLLTVGAAAAIVIVTVLLLNRPHSSVELADLGQLSFEKQTLIRSFGLNECENWVGSSPRLQFQKGNRVMLNAGSQTLIGSGALRASADPSWREIELVFGEVSVGADMYTLSGTLIVPASSNRSADRTGSLKLIFQSAGKPAIEVQRTLAAAN